MLTLSQFFHSCSVLPNSIKRHTSKTDYLQQFRQVFSSQEAKDASNVVYAFVCKKRYQESNLKVQSYTLDKPNRI